MKAVALILATGASVTVDLTSVDQDEYQRLTAGDRVIVTATLPLRAIDSSGSPSTGSPINRRGRLGRSTITVQ